MKRLTEQNPNWINNKTWKQACEPSCEEIDAVYRKLKGYEDLEEQGKLIKLPCKVGDTLYTYCEMIGDVLPYTVVQAVINWDNFDKESYYVLDAIASDDGGMIDAINVGQDDIGKTVFLTEEGAEIAFEQALDWNQGLRKGKK